MRGWLQPLHKAYTMSLKLISDGVVCLLLAAEGISYSRVDSEGFVAN